jgi:hypothetical protein
LLFAIVIVGPPLASLGLGGTLVGIAIFLAVFGVAGTLVMARELRPAVSLSSSTERARRDAGARESLSRFGPHLRSSAAR